MVYVTDSLIYSNAVGGFTFTPLIFSPGFTSVKLADHTGDGKPDVGRRGRDRPGVSALAASRPRAIGPR